MNNLERLQSAVAGAGLEALLVSNIKHVGWVSGFTGSNGFVLVTPSSAFFLTDGRYTAQSEQEVKNAEITIYSPPKTEASALLELMQGAGLSSVGFEGGSVLYSSFERWEQAFAGVKLIPTSGIVENLTLIKAPDEIESLRRACRLTDECFSFLTQRIQPGLREWDIQMELEFFIRKQQAELSFDPIVVSGENGAKPHGHATDKILERGELLTLDFGAKVDGYCADLTRTVAIGSPSQELRDMYNLVLKSQLAALEAIKPGVKAHDIDLAARKVLDEKDMSKYFTHGLGHGLGRQVHDGGRLGPNSPTIMEPGQVWTVEPGVYIPGLGGVRIEDDIVVTDSGIEILNSSTKELLELG